MPRMVGFLPEMDKQCLSLMDQRCRLVVSRILCLILDVDKTDLVVQLVLRTYSRLCRLDKALRSVAKTTFADLL